MYTPTALCRVDVTDTKSIEALVQEVKDSGKGIFGYALSPGPGQARP
jgi:hypothetical protein